MKSYSVSMLNQCTRLHIQRSNRENCIVLDDNTLGENGIHLKFSTECFSDMLLVISSYITWFSML